MSKKKLKSPEFAISMSQGFYISGKNLAKHSNADNKTGYIWIAPAVVNFSFATELLLKGLIMIDTNVSSRGHKLLKLYELVKPDTKKKIKKLYDERTNSSTNDLPSYKIVFRKDGQDEKNPIKGSTSQIEEILAIHSESFENWRYLYEFDEGGFEYEFDFRAMDNLYTSMRDVLTELLKNRPKRFAMKKV